MAKSLLLLVLTLAASCSLLSAGTITINAGEIVQYTFTTDATSFGCPPAYTPTDCDTLLLEVPFTSPLPDDVTAELFNGSSLLGSFSGGCCLVAFESASSVYGFGSVVDFSSIQSGSFNGVIDLSSSQPFVLPTGSSATVYLGHATSYFATSDSIYSATLTGESIVPEPSQDAGIAALVFLACIGVRHFAGWRASR